MSSRIIASVVIAGVPARVRVEAGRHALSGVVLDNSTATSELWIDGDAGSVLELLPAGSAEAGRRVQETGPDGGALLTIREGAPPVHLRGLIIIGAVHVEGGLLELSDCTFLGLGDAAVDGRRLRLTSGYVSVFGSTLTNSSGGAIEVHGGSLIVVQSAFWHNTANFGGAVRVSGGHVELNHCHLEGNRATGQGGAMARSWPLSNP